MFVTSQAARLAVCVVSALSVGSLDISRLAGRGKYCWFSVYIHRSDLEDGEQEGASCLCASSSHDYHFNWLLGLLASAPAPGDNVLDEGVEIVGVAHREVFEYPLDATTKALKIALRRRAFQEDTKFECRRVSFTLTRRSKILATKFECRRIATSILERLLF